MRTLRLLFALFFAFNVQAQLVTSSSSASNLVQNVLIGNGVTVSNITYTGSSGAIGSFTANGTNLGFTSGIVMTTGTIANNGDGPQGPNNQANAGVDNGYGGYSLLDNQLGGAATTYNAAVLEFDFVPLSDTVQFRYVFGSEEYMEYVHSQWNDIFGFFISGPGISGTQNIALLPNGQFVAINNVHMAGSNTFATNFPAENGSYYVDNSSGTTIQYDGFTTPLTAISKVQCGKTYHLIIALADVGDGIYDSGIFLEANSFKSPVSLTVNSTVPFQYYNNLNILPEPCGQVTVFVNRTGDLSSSLSIPINVTGTATNGVDYTGVPTQVNFAANQSQTSFVINTVPDALAEGQETIDLNFQIPDPCGNSNQTTVEYYIQDVDPLVVAMDSAQVMCPGNTATLTPVVTGGTGVHSYVWNTGDTTSTYTASPPITTNYTVTVHDACLNQDASANADIFVPTFGPILLNSSADTSNPCPYEPYDFFVEATGGAGDYTYRWYDNQGNNFGTEATQHVVSGYTTSYYVQVTDRCGVSATDTIVVTVTSPPLVVNVLGDTTICFGDSALLTATATGGWGAHHFYWPFDGDTTAQNWIVPRHTDTYTVQVQDDCRTFTVPGSGKITVLRPIANFEISSQTLYEDLPITFHNTTYGGTYYQWEFGDGQTSTETNPNNTYDTSGTYYITLHAQNSIGCRDSVTKPITILPEFYIYIPNTITPNGDGINDFFAASTINVVQFEIYIFDRWGEQLFHSTDKRFQWDATIDGKPVEDGVYVYKVHYISINGDDKKIVGHVVVLR